MKRGNWNEAEDHIALELEFMQRMALRAAEALSDNAEDEAIAYLRTSYDFLENHLMNWVPMLVADMRMHARTLFYQAWGSLPSAPSRRTKPSCASFWIPWKLKRPLAAQTLPTPSFFPLPSSAPPLLGGATHFRVLPRGVREEATWKTTGSVPRNYATRCFPSRMKSEEGESYANRHFSSN